MNMGRPLEGMRDFCLRILASLQEMGRKLSLIILIGRECLQSGQRICGRLYRFDLGNNEKSKRWVYFAISRSWRNWKALLKKKYYKPYHTIHERLQHCSARVNSDQWASLVTFWGSQEGVARSRRNSINREAQTMSHTAGTKSFARIREEARARDPNGQVLDRMEVFRMTHTRRDGQLVDQASEDVMIGLLFFYTGFWGFFPLYQAYLHLPSRVLSANKGAVFWHVSPLLLLHG